MKKIRTGVFETNSSSMHSLVIRGDNAMYEDEAEYFTDEEILDSMRRYINKKNIYNAKWDDWYFGRNPFQILDTFNEKMQYAFANAYTYDEVFSIVQEHAPTIKKITIPESLGVDDYCLKGWLKKAGITLEEFLINRRYIVICDGDEYCIWDDIKASGVVDTSIFQEVGNDL